jgi:hypothetical protein
MSDSMLSATGGGYWGAWVLNDPVQQVSHRYQIIQGCYNAGSNCGFEVSVSVLKQRIWPSMCKCQSYKRTSYRHIEWSITQHFRHVVRICYDWGFSSLILRALILQPIPIFWQFCASVGKRAPSV